MPNSNESLIKKELLAVRKQVNAATRLINEGRNWQAANILNAITKELDISVQGFGSGKGN